MVTDDSVVGFIIMFVGILGTAFEAISPFEGAVLICLGWIITSLPRLYR